MDKVLAWVCLGGHVDDSSIYVGGVEEVIVLDSSTNFGGLKRMVAELMNVDIGSEMDFSFDTGNPRRPLYTVKDDRTFVVWMTFAREDRLKHKLYVNYQPIAASTPEAFVNPYDEDVENEQTTDYAYAEQVHSPIPPISTGSRLTPQQSPSPEASPGNDVQPQHVKLLCDNGECGMFGSVDVNQIFKSKKDLLTSLSIVAMKEKFEYKSFKSRKKLLVVKCVIPNCEWRVRAKGLKGCGYWQVTKFIRNHSNHPCPADFTRRRHRQARSWVVGECVRKKLVYPGRVFKPKDLITDIRLRYGVDISYTVAWRGRELAYDNMRLGSPEQSYTLLPAYLHMLQEKNPGSVVKLETGKDCKFVQLFIAFSASVYGFAYCRPVVSIDATYLKGKYRGVLFTAVCHDANQQIFPIAFGIGGSENIASWKLFLSCLKEVIGERNELVIVSDRHKSIERGVAEVFPDAFHGLCMYHLLNNLRSKFKIRAKHVEELYYQTAKVYNFQEFDVLFFSLCSSVPGIKEYLEEVGKERWTRSYSPSRRYNILTTNISESMNAVLVDVRNHPITSLVDGIRELCQRWFQERRNRAQSSTTMMSVDVEEKLHLRLNEAQGMTSECADEYNFNVRSGYDNHCVDTRQRTCTCRKFQLEQLPCEHMLAITRNVSNSSPYDFCSPYYSVQYWYESYRGVVHPIPNASCWEVPNDVGSFVLKPPDVSSSTGRRRKRRILSVGEEASRPKCSRCRQAGHNRATCQNPIALHPLSQPATTDFDGVHS